MESTGSTFPKWQLAILIGAPLAIGFGYLYYRNASAIEEETDEDKKAGKKLKDSSKSLSIDGDSATASAAPSADTVANGVESKNFKKLSPFEQAVKYKENGNDSFKNGKYDSAIELYDQAIEICPKAKTVDLSQFYQNRAAAYEQLKKWKNVSDDCTKVRNVYLTFKIFNYVIKFSGPRFKSKIHQSSSSTRESL